MRNEEGITVVELSGFMDIAEQYTHCLATCLAYSLGDMDGMLSVVV